VFLGDSTNPLGALLVSAWKAAGKIGPFLLRWNGFLG
jgi:hypothetical protein